MSHVPSWSTLPPFETLDQCLTYIKLHHPQHKVPVMAKALGTGESAGAEMPAWLYRGEVGWFAQCLSRKERVRQGHFAGVTTQEIDPLSQEIDRDLQERLRLDPMLSTGLAQHYGLPTELMDASDSLDVAGFFARCEAGEHAMGAVAVFDMNVLTRNAIVIDLTSHPTAVRPRRQSGYGVFHRKHMDLKAPDARADMGLRWYTFLKDPNEAARLAGGDHLLSVADDPTAGLLRLWLDDYVSERGKLTHALAEHLAHRIAHCPLVANVVSWRTSTQPSVVDALTPAQAGIKIDLQKEIDTSLKLWSCKWPRMERRP